MKRLLRLASAVLGFAFVLATPLAASASTQERFSVAGSGAEAGFGSCSDLTLGGQICTGYRIGVSSQITKADGTKSSETTLSIDIFTYSIDSSGMVTFISETAGFGVPSWSIDSRLMRASATASFPVISCGVDSCVDGTVSVLASWTGQGDLLHDVSNFHFSKGPFSLNSHLNGNARVASATATVNGNDVGASLFAEMHNVKSGDIVICHMC